MKSTVQLEEWKQVSNTSDGCSFPWGFNWLNDSKISCLCLQHDYDYGFGSKYGMTRIQADEELRDGIIAAGEPYKARIMYLAVRIFGHQYFTNFRSFNEDTKKPTTLRTFDTNRFL